MAATQKKTAETQKKRENTAHVRLPVETIEELDKIAKENNINRSAVIAIACSRLLKTGI
jgi:metal-responsive CopG/Arc/MetJ family transcriptional regulator